jgi:guanylate kinase
MKGNFESLAEKSEGQKLYEILSQLNLQSCRLRKENLEQLKQIDSIIIIGSSWTGKTTVRNMFSEIRNDDISFPKRVVTREQRPGDNLDENEFAEDLDDLKSKVNGGIIWKRDLGESSEYYGFKKAEEDSLPIYSGNNVLVRSRRELIQGSSDVIDNSLILLTYAPDDERGARNIKREGDYLEAKPLEKEIRASDRAVSMYPEAHIVVKNFDGQDAEAQRKDLEKILEAIKELKG